MADQTSEERAERAVRRITANSTNIDEVSKIIYEELVSLDAQNLARLKLIAAQTSDKNNENVKKALELLQPKAKESK